MDGYVISYICIGFTVAAGVTLVMRCISRFYIVKSPQIDDYLIIAAFLADLATTCLIHIQAGYGLGRWPHEQSANPEYRKFIKYLWASTLTFDTSLTLLKVSAFSQYLRFLVEPWLRITCWILIVVCGVSGALAVAAHFFFCRPLAYMWNRTIPNGSCMVLSPMMWYIASSWLVVTDIMMVAIPIFAVKSLTMPRTQKKLLMIVFAFGGLGCIISVLRLTPIFLTYSPRNFLQSIAQSAWLLCVEINIGIICVSLPPLKALFVTVSQHLKQVSNKKSTQRSQSSTDYMLDFANFASSSRSVNSSKQPTLRSWNAEEVE